MITSPGGSGVLVIGGFNYNADDYSIAIMELKGNTFESLEWTTLKPSLQFNRKNHVALPIPDEFAQCDDEN